MIGRLAGHRVAIPGWAGGGTILVTLVRAGVGKFHIADMDRFEPVNINQQHGARGRYPGTAKVDVMKRDALAINPHLDVKTFPTGIGPENMDVFWPESAWWSTGSIFVWKTRRALFNRARALKHSVVTVGPIGFGVIGLNVHPGQDVFRRLFRHSRRHPDLEAILKFYVGIVLAVAPHLRNALAHPPGRAGRLVHQRGLMLWRAGCLREPRASFCDGRAPSRPRLWHFRRHHRHRYAQGRLRWKPGPSSKGQVVALHVVS